jgi:SAM-dependent methyltransferase
VPGTLGDAVADTPFPLPDDDVAARLLATFDAEGKIPRALAALGPVEGRDVALLDADRGFRAAQLALIGARLTLLESPDRVEALRAAATGIAGVADIRSGTAEATGLPDASVDVLVCLWSSFRGPSPVAQVAEADRVLRPDGRLLVVHDYGRDDHVRMEPTISDDATAWSRRDGWFLTHGFRIRVIHAFWTFADAAEAPGLLGAAFGEPGSTVAAELTRPRASHNVAVYHRSRGGVPWTPPEGDVAREGPGDAPRDLHHDVRRDGGTAAPSGRPGR